MARRTFFSFHYKFDNWRVAKVRDMGVVEDNKPVSDNDWETIKGGGDRAIKDWIAGQLKGRTCTIVLVGERTAGRKWIKYEIEGSWKAGMGVVGIRIHKLEDGNGEQSRKGGNPFDDIKIGGEKLSTIVKLYDPPQITSKGVYDHIKKNIADWVEEAIEIRRRNQLRWLTL
jgi:hypothetical protein